MARDDASGRRDYSVGYGKPPVEHRFTKGQSGNSKGRPRGAMNRPQVKFDGALQPTDELILEEAYRPVAIREGERTIELPAIQAAVRALAISAMKEAGCPSVPWRNSSGPWRIGNPTSA